ncbi:MAG: multicopper oxidase domain-containing protein, partial [Methylocystis sp.]|nr:multicopper oxidase domain-containing protein [Methylocystis sp.]
MHIFDRLSRRRFVSGAASAAAGLAASCAFAESIGGERSAPQAATEGFTPDVEIELIAKRDSVRIFPSKATDVWRFAGNLVKGPPNTLTAAPDSYLGPTMRFVKGQKIRIRLKNELPEETIAHWHGLHVPMLADGHPMAAIAPGGTYVYEFEMRNRASFYFYHPHPHEATATQVYRGLAGAIIVEDEEERALGLPSGEFEIPLVIQDRSFTRENQLFYSDDMHTSMFGFHGDTVLVLSLIHI